MQRLKIVEAGVLPVVSPDSVGSGVEVWPDVDGRVRAYTYVSAGRCWVHYPRAATFSFRTDEAVVTAVPVPGVDRAVIEDVFLRFVLPLATQAAGREVLHASAVSGPAGGLVAICGDSGAGKSTIAYGLAERGYRPWADDAVCFEVRNDRPCAVPLPFVRRLRTDAAAYFGGVAERFAKGSSRPTEVPRRGAVERFSALFIAERRRRPTGRRSVEVRKIPSIEVFRTILPYCQPFTLGDPSLKRRMVEQYLQLSAVVPTFELRFRPGLRELPTVLDAIERTVASVRRGARLERLPCAP